MKFTGDIQRKTILDKALKVVETNTPYQLGFAGIKGSAYSFGQCQFDIGQGTHLDDLLNILDTVKNSAGISFVSPTTRADLQKAALNKTDSLTGSEKAEVNAALASPKGMEMVDALYDNALTTMLQDYDSILKRVSNPQRHAFLSSPVGLAFSCEFMNQVNPGGAWLKQWATTGSVKMLKTDDTAVIHGALGVGDIFPFYWSHKFTQAHLPAQMHNIDGVLESAGYVCTTEEDARELLNFFNNQVNPNKAQFLAIKKNYGLAIFNDFVTAILGPARDVLSKLYGDSGKATTSTAATLGDGGAVSAKTANTLVIGDTQDNVLTDQFGNGVLNGGAGNDTYIASNGDVILDSDGKGSISIGGAVLGAKTKPYLKPDGTGYTDGTFNYNLENGDLVITKTTVPESSFKVTVRNAPPIDQLKSSNSWMGLQFTDDHRYASISRGDPAQSVSIQSATADGTPLVVTMADNLQNADVYFSVDPTTGTLSVSTAGAAGTYQISDWMANGANCSVVLPDSRTTLGYQEILNTLSAQHQVPNDYSSYALTSSPGQAGWLGGADANLFASEISGAAGIEAYVAAHRSDESTSPYAARNTFAGYFEGNATLSDLVYEMDSVVATDGHVWSTGDAMPGIQEQQSVDGTKYWLMTYTNGVNHGAVYGGPDWWALSVIGYKDASGAIRLKAVGEETGLNPDASGNSASVLSGWGVNPLDTSVTNMDLASMVGTTAQTFLSADNVKVYDGTTQIAAAAPVDVAQPNVMAVLGDSPEVAGVAADTTYQVSALQGDTTLTNFDPTGETLAIAVDTTPVKKSLLLARQVGTDLVLLNRANGHSLTVGDYFSATADLSSRKVVSFSDGTSWFGADITALVSIPSVDPLTVTLSDTASVWALVPAYRDENGLVRYDLTTAEQALAAVSGTDAGSALLKQFTSELKQATSEVPFDYLQFVSYFANQHIDTGLAVLDGTTTTSVIHDDTTTQWTSTDGLAYRLIDGGQEDKVVIGSNQDQSVTVDVGQGPQTFTGADEVWDGGGDTLIEAGKGDNFLKLHVGFSASGQWESRDGNVLVDTRSGGNNIIADNGDSESQTMILLGATSGKNELRELPPGVLSQCNLGDWNASDSTRPRDTIQFDDSVTPDSVTLTRTGDDLTIGVSGTNAQLLVRDAFVGDQLILGSMQFADGTTWAADSLPEGLISDTVAFDLSAQAEQQVFTQDETWSMSYQIALAGADASSTSASRDGDDLVIQSATGGSLRLTNFYGQDGPTVDSITLADGTAMDLSTLSDLPWRAVSAGCGEVSIDASHIWPQGTRDILFGEGWAPGQLRATKSGGDLLLASTVNEGDAVRFLNYFTSADNAPDLLRFADGESFDPATLLVVDAIASEGTLDSRGMRVIQLPSAQNELELDGDGSRADVTAGTGELLFKAGSGDVTVHAEGGPTTFVLGRNDGHDTFDISAADAQSGGPNCIVFNDTVTAADVTYTRSLSGDLVLTVSGGATTLVVQDYFNGAAAGLSSIQFADGTMQDLSMFDGLQPVVGAFDGQLTADEVSANRLTFSPAISPSQVSVARDLLGNVTISVQGGTTTVTIPEGYASGIPGVIFADGTSWTGTDVVAHASMGATDASASNAETLTFALGDGACLVNQAKTAGAAQNTLAFAAGISPSDVHLVRQGDDLVVLVGAQGDQLTVPGYFTGGVQAQFAAFSFADGSQWSAAAAAATEADASFAPNDGAQLAVLSSAAASRITVGAQFSSADLHVSVNSDGNLLLSVPGSADSLTLLNWSNTAAAQNASVQFSDGTTWGYADLLHQLSLATQDYSSPDAQAVVFSSGDGLRTVTQHKPWGSSQNTLVLGAGVTAGDVVFLDVGHDLVVKLRSGDQLTVPGYFSDYNSANQFSSIQYGDGTTIAGTAMPVEVDSSDSVWNQWGYPYIDLGGEPATHPTTVQADTPNTYIWGGQGDITVHSTADNVGLSAGGGTNTFELGAGQNGNNFYDWRGGTGEHNFVQFDASVQKSDITFQIQPWGSLVMTDTVTGGSLTLQNFLQSGMPLDGVNFADGTSMSLADIRAQYASVPNADGTLQLADGQSYWGGATAGTITGGAGWGTVLKGSTAGDTLIGGSGFAGLFATAGDNLLELGSGGGYMYGGSGTDLLMGHAGAYAYEQGKQGVAQLLYGGNAGDNLNGQGVLIAGGDQSWLSVSGQSVVAFDKGDGAQTVYGLGQWSMQSENSTISVGGGVEDSDIYLTRDGQNLVLHMGGADSITLGNWYPWDPQSPGTNPHVNLQVIESAAADFDASSSDALKSAKVQDFDLNAFAAAFDAAQAADSSVTQFSLNAAATQFLTSTSDTAAYGGDLAYYYGTQNSLGGLSADSARAVLKDAGFGGLQTLHDKSSLQQGTQLPTGH